MRWVRWQSLKVAATYIAVAGLWIILSDRVLLNMLPQLTADKLAEWGTLKGLFFVLVTGAMLYWMVYRSLRLSDRSQRQYRDLFQMSPNGIFVTTEKGIQFINTAGVKLLGAQSAEQIIGRNPMDFIHPDFHHIVRRRIETSKRTGQPAPPVEEKWIRIDGTVVNVEVFAAGLSYQGQPAAQVILRDLSERKASEALLYHTANHDLLTDLPNVSLLKDRITQEIIHANRFKRSVALLVLDIARLQFINDSYGYEAGDTLLKTLAQSLRAAVRSGDTVARIGGDQFAVLLSDLHDRSGLLTAIEKIRSTLVHSYAIAGQDVYVTLRSGVASWPENGENTDALLKNAIAACHRAKKSGSPDTEFYTPSISAAARKRVTLEQALIEAIANREFLMYFQPKIAAATGAIAGCEALIRWNNPKLGLVSPADFIPLAEETGHIQQIGDWAMREACHQMSLWQQQGLGAVPTAVNLSALQLNQPGLGAMVSELIYQYGLAPSSLMLELTESMIMNNLDHTRSVINHLRAMGIKLSLDDFGTGYSSFSYLKTFRMDELKIDMSFIRDITRNENDARITQAIIIMGHGLGMHVIAEGVETAEQARLLESWGCDNFQGYYFSPPVAAAEFTRMLEDSKEFSWNDKRSSTSPSPV